MGGPLLCLAEISNVGGPRVGSRAPCAFEFALWCRYVLPPVLSTVHKAMNADLLAPGSNVFHLRSTTRERVAATVFGLSSLPECVTIS